MIAHYEAHITSPDLLGAYKHVSYALSELSALCDLVASLDN